MFLIARRNLTGLFASLVFVFFAGCEAVQTSGFSGDVDALLSRGATYVNALEGRPGEELSDEEVVAVGYLERARLGLGSPFRLIDYLLRDPALSEDVRTRLAYGVLSRTLEGRSYEVDPRVLEVAPVWGLVGPGWGHEQVRLIERAIASAPNAAAGERTIRIGYLLASAERTIEPGASSIAVHVAAMVGDRRRAREDASLLLRAAARTGSDPLVMLRTWRRGLRFQVEQPALVGLSVRDEAHESREAPVFALALRTLAQRLSVPGVSPAGVARTQTSEGGLLDVAAAERLAALAAERAYPAQAPIAVAVEINRQGLLGRSDLPAAQREARDRFADESWNEERLIAHLAMLRGNAAERGARPSLIMLQAATFLRVWNQESPWFPGDPAPTARDLEARFGLSGVRFGEDVDPRWQPYYLRMLAQAISDVQRVIPTVSVRGLTVVVGTLPGDTRALALHEPRTRTLYLPPMTGAGTIAHELAHDLDWQLARRRYGTRGGYATDLAVRDKRGDRIASAMMGLSAALAQPSADGEQSAHNTRPAEVFARGVDWLVAAMMAREHWLGGYLTSFQDPVLTGYGTTRGPDVTGAAVPALLSILDAIAPVEDSGKEWALDNYGPARTLTGNELVRVISEAGAGLPPEERLQVIAAVGEQSLGAISDCRFGSIEGVRRLLAAQRELAEVTIRAAARGAAFDAIHALAELHGGPEMRPAVNEWMAARLYGAPEPADSIVAEVAPAFEDLLLRANLVGRQPRPVQFGTAFEGVRPPTFCGGNPFAAESPIGRFRSSIATLPS